MSDSFKLLRTGTSSPEPVHEVSVGTTEELNCLNNRGEKIMATDGINFRENQLKMVSKVITLNDNVGIIEEESQELGQEIYITSPVRLESKLIIPGKSELRIPIKDFDVASETILFKPFDRLGVG